MSFFNWSPRGLSITLIPIWGFTVLLFCLFTFFSFSDNEAVFWGRFATLVLIVNLSLSLWDNVNQTTQTLIFVILLAFMLEINVGRKIPLKVNTAGPHTMKQQCCYFSFIRASAYLSLNKVIILDLKPKSCVTVIFTERGKKRRLNAS